MAKFTFLFIAGLLAASTVYGSSGIYELSCHERSDLQGKKLADLVVAIADSPMTFAEYQKRIDARTLIYIKSGWLANVQSGNDAVATAPFTGKPFFYAVAPSETKNTALLLVARHEDSEASNAGASDEEYDAGETAYISFLLGDIFASDASGYALKTNNSFRATLEGADHSYYTTYAMPVFCKLKAKSKANRQK